MTGEEFNRVLLDVQEQMRLVLFRKSGEYARDNDRFSNFKRAAAAMGITPEQACVAFWMKHVVSITDLVNDLQKGHYVAEPMWDEKIGDALNYLALLKGLVKERILQGRNA